MHFLLCTGIFPPEIGGPATVIYDLAERLKRAGHGVQVITYGDVSEQAEGLTRVTRKKILPLRYLTYALAVRNALRPDTRVVCTDVFSTGIPVRFALLGRSNPLFMRLGGEWCWEDAVTKGRFYGTLSGFWDRTNLSWRDGIMRRNYAWILERAERIFLTAEFLQRVVSKIVPLAAPRMLVVPNIVQPLEIGGRAAEPPHKPLRLLYVGRFAPVKNVPFLAYVLRDLHEAGESVACTFAGDGNDLEKVREIVNELPRMDFLGPVPASALRHLFTKSDILVLPSLSDVCPNVVLEALASRVPCLITSEHGLGKLDGVIELDPLDPRAWIDTIRLLKNPAEYENLQTQARLTDECIQPRLFDLLITNASEPK